MNVGLTTAVHVDFLRSGNSDAFVLEGWSFQEDLHRWTSGRRSSLSLPRPDRAGDYLLSLDVLHLLQWPAHPFQRVGVTLNGVRLGLVCLRTAGLLDFWVPWDLIRTRHDMVLHLDLPDAATPSSATGANDHRLLAIALRRVTLTYLDDPVAASGEPAARVMAAFENIGLNCEFGLVQRQFGVDQMGLLRFASAPLPALAAGLRHRFEGLGAPGSLLLEVNEGDQEYLVKDRRYGLVWHSWVLAHQRGPDEVMMREEKRLALMVRRFLKLLEQGRRILVRAEDAAGEAEMRELAALLRCHGDTRLLWVVSARHPEEAGTVRDLGGGLLLGAVERLARVDWPVDIAFESWLALCRRTLSLPDVSAAA